MCGRFTYAKEFREIRILFDPARDIPLFSPRYNIAPGQDVPVIVSREGTADVRMMRWGLVPSWAQDAAIGNRMINARAETLTQRPAFRELLGRRRCLVPADSFYEWRKEGKYKAPVRIVLKSGEPFAFAGLWDRWRKPDGSALYSFTVITTDANEYLRRIHDRMPAMLSGEDAMAWLNGEEIRHALSLLKPYPADLVEGYEVSRLVNDPRNDLPACVEPA